MSPVQWVMVQRGVHFTMAIRNIKIKAWVALVLFAPAPTVEVLLALYANQGTFGAFLWACAKAWLLIGPALWLVGVEGYRLSFPKLKTQGLKSAVSLGIAMLGVIVAAYLAFAYDQMDISSIQSRLAAVGLSSPSRYVVMALYWTLINALVEEYIFRFFLFRQCQYLMSPQKAVIASALIFTVHHTVALAVYLSWWQNLLASVGVLVAGLIFSWLYQKTKNIWSSYVCHIFADIGVFGVGAFILYG